ncbi:MAG: alanine dehydrogenase [Clostridium sp.]
MIIGVPKEVKNNEYRVAMIPSGVQEFIKNNHEVLAETDAGIGSGFCDEDYKNAGAQIVEKDILFKRSEMIYKVKEFLPEEFKYLREGMIIFTYIHSNAFRSETDAFLESRVVGISYEDIEDKNGKMPLLKPMSEIAGKGGFLMAMQYTQKINGGNGLLLSRVHGVRTPEVTIIGAGVAGLGAAEIASSLGNKVTILGTNLDNLERKKHILPPNVELLYSNKENLLMCLKRSDVIVNCILWPKDREDHLITRDMLKSMKKGTLIVDVSCDEGGAIETCRATSHDNPVYFEEGIMHYCVDNIPAAFPQTATYALCNATLPYALEIANKGYEIALRENKYLRKGLCFYFGELTLEETGKKQNRGYKTPEQVLNM